MPARPSPQRRLVVPEVVQTSAMDCGPASLKVLLEGFGITVSYGRLREACQTDVDGTSIDTLEVVAGQLGLWAEQVMVPVDHLLLPEAGILPALVVVRASDGLTHFVVLWRRHGPLVQVMDPAKGRRWLHARRFLETVFVHDQTVAAADLLAWASSEPFRLTLERRLRDLGCRHSTRVLIDRAVSGPGWQPLARLDSAARLVTALVRGGGIRRGNEACKVLDSLLEPSPGRTPDSDAGIPGAFWSVRPAAASDGQEMVWFRGAVLIAVYGRHQPCSAEPGDAPRPADTWPGEGGAVLHAATASGHGAGSEPDELGMGDGPSGEIPDTPTSTDGEEGVTPVHLSPELAAALAEPNSRPNRLFLQFLGEGRGLPLVVLGIGLTLVTAGSFLEEALLPGLIAVRRELGLVEQRGLAVVAWLVFASLWLLIELRIVGALVRLGRRLEVRLRTAFLDKIPRLNDRYFSSRTLADMATRGHLIHHVRGLPLLAGRFFRSAVALGITAGALAWVDPANAPWTLLAAGLALGLPLVFNSLLAERDYRVRTYDGALLGFYYDALRGLAAVRAHGAERVMRREHEGLLVEWALASQALVRWGVVLQGFEAFVGFGLAGWLLLQHGSRATDAAGLLLLAYWALNLPELGREIAVAAAQYPINRSLLLRLVEPLGAPEDPPTAAALPVPVDGPRSPADRPGVAITFEGVTVRASGQRILEAISAHLDAGSHVAIVGRSGAGKSSLVGLLLGWHRPAAGRVLVDGDSLDAARMEELRNETAWVDPAVQLWNRPLLENLRYGVHPGRGMEPLPIGTVLDEADLYEVLRRMPAGLQTPLGEGGGFLSGGEGQRVRLGRALSRVQARLVILDEPFRGLDRGKRRELLGRARRLWHDATLLCISHDVAMVTDFDRVLVIEEGRLAEDGPPALLATAPDSRFRAFLDAEDALHTGIWSSPLWRRLRMTAGHLTGVCEEGCDGDAASVMPVHRSVDRGRWDGTLRNADGP